MKPSCRDVCDHATVFLEGGATGPEWEALQQHLARCPACAEYLRQLGLTVEALRCLPEACGERARAELLARYEAWIAARDRS